jgi:hypothetical protein
MGRVKVVKDKLGKFPYYVEMWDGETKLWKAEVRYYEVEQDVGDYPDNEKRRNFKALGKEPK